ncbi:MAG: hypothetical protein R6U66_08150 [Bacteroidales bacterium]
MSNLIQPKNSIPRFALKAFLLLMPIFWTHVVTSRAQLLHTESFSVILDSSRTIQGAIVPNLEFQTQAEDLLEFENIADFSFRLTPKHAFTIANKIELSKYGKEVLLSGGYLYIEYRGGVQQTLALEPYAQVLWSEARGLAMKYAAGINARWRIWVEENIGIFAGTGPFYEIERWNYQGVPNRVLLPEDLPEIKVQTFKWGTYLSFKYVPFDAISLDASFYHQSRIEDFFYTPRLASSASITWNLTQYLGITFVYQQIYDYNPIVPIDKDFHKIIMGVEISF